MTARDTLLELVKPKAIVYVLPKGQLKDELYIDLLLEDYTSIGELAAEVLGIPWTEYGAALHPENVKYVVYKLSEALFPDWNGRTTDGKSRAGWCLKYGLGGLLPITRVHLDLQASLNKGGKQ